MYEEGACACGNAIEILDVSPMATSLVLSLSLYLCAGKEWLGRIPDVCVKPPGFSLELGGREWNVENEPAEDRTRASSTHQICMGNGTSDCPGASFTHDVSFFPQNPSGHEIRSGEAGPVLVNGGFKKALSLPSKGVLKATLLTSGIGLVKENLETIWEGGGQNLKMS